MTEKSWTIEEYANEPDSMLYPVYISGPISLLPYEVAKTRFIKTQDKLQEAGFTLVENPVVFCSREMEYEDCMRRCIDRLLDCKAVIMQRLWWISRGARLERKLAIAVGMDVIYE